MRVYDMVTLIHDQTHTRRSIALSETHISINAVHSSSHCFFFSLFLYFLSSFHSRHPMILNDELTKFRLLFIIHFRNHMCAFQI